ncbi:MAG TPA: glycosyltransferase family 2 protein [Terriglobales bacterium]|nr:glycosyltransferase family 2 protein [Terriglobales bacterium]
MSLALSVVIITLNEERNLGRTLESVKPLVENDKGEIIVVDSGSTDRTVEIAKSFGAKVFVEEWKGFAAQKNSAIEKAEGEWVLSLDADEEVSSELAAEVAELPSVWNFWNRQEFPTSDDALAIEMRKKGLRYFLNYPNVVGFYVKRQNLFLGRWVRQGGYWPDCKLRVFRRGAAQFEERVVHENAKLLSPKQLAFTLDHPLIHHAYPTLQIYLEHMRRYADLGAEMIKDKPRWWLWLNRWLNPPLTFFYNYVIRLGFLDRREGFLLHWNHRRYVGWKYAKALELSHSPRSRGAAEND